MPTIDELKGLFAQGKRPDGIDFEQLIDATYGNGVTLNDTFTSDSKTEAATANVAKILKTQFDNINVNASSTVRGLVTVKDGLNVNNGAISANFFVDDNKNLNSMPSEFLIGETITVVTTASANALQMSINQFFYQLMGYTTTSAVAFRYRIKTTKNTNSNIYQEITVYSNATGSPQRFILTRSGNATAWQSWAVNPTIAINNGNPNGSVSGFRGFLVLDTTNGVLYVKTTGLASGDNMGWESVGGRGV